MNPAPELFVALALFTVVHKLWMRSRRRRALRVFRMYQALEMMPALVEEIVLALRKMDAAAMSAQEAMHALSAAAEAAGPLEED